MLYDSQILQHIWYTFQQGKFDQQFYCQSCDEWIKYLLLVYIVFNIIPHYILSWEISLFEYTKSNHYLNGTYHFYIITQIIMLNKSNANVAK